MPAPTGHRSNRPVDGRRYWADEVLPAAGGVDRTLILGYEQPLPDPLLSNSP